MKRYDTSQPWYRRWYEVMRSSDQSPYKGWRIWWKHKGASETDAIVVVRGR